jgi:putative SOS response-associated peptidase YedK
MAVIVPTHGENFWLDPNNEDYEGLLSLLKPYPSEGMAYYRVSPRVNSPAFDSPENVDRV